MKRSAPAGFSLIELMVSVAITAVAIAATISVVISLTSMTRNAENYSDDVGRARTGATNLTRAIEGTGLMTPGGLWVNTATGPTLINTIFGIDGTTGAGFAAGGAAPVVTGPDDLWVITPDRNAFREGCVDKGAGVSLNKTVATGVLTVQCPTAIATFAVTDFLVAANATTGALLSPPLVLGLAGTTATIGYAEQAVSGYSAAPPPGEGFTKGDLVYAVNVFHYAIRNNPMTSRPALIRHRGMTGTEPVTKRPFVEDPAYSDEVIQDYVEDLQVSFGLENPGTGAITFQPSLAPAFNAGAPLRSVRINVVVMGRQRDLANDATRTFPLTPLTVDNHVASTTADGFRRVLFTQRIEVPNAAPGNL